MSCSSIRWVALAALVGCASRQSEDKGEEFLDVTPLAIPPDFQSRDTAVVMRLTNANPPERTVRDAMVRIANTLELTDMLTRGGLPDGPVGAGGVSSAPGEHPAMLAGTAVEQVRARFERVLVDQQGLFPTDVAVDACGNPMIGAFILPSQLQHAALGEVASEPSWPAACTAADCDTLEAGTLDVYFSDPRPNGMLDMVINLYADTTVSPPKPALYGHMLAYFLTNNMPGFIEVPVVVNAKQVTMVLSNLWQRSRAYVDGHGVREIYVFPQAARTVLGEEINTLLVANRPDHCQAAWDGRFEGQPPFGCVEEAGLLVDRNAPAGEDVYTRYAQNGDEPALLRDLQFLWQYQLSTYASCIAVTEKAYIQDGPVELFLCPPELGTADHCVAEIDLERGMCEPLEVEQTVVTPQDATPIPLPQQAFPYVLEPYDPTAVATLFDTGSGTGTGTGTGTGFTPLVPFSGNQVNLEIPVEEGTVLFLGDPARVGAFRDEAGNEVPLPTELTLPCDEGATTTRYEVGRDLPAGTYTLVMEWSDAAEPFLVGVSSVDSWVF